MSCGRCSASSDPAVHGDAGAEPGAAAAGRGRFAAGVARGHARLATFLLVTGITALAFNLRPTITSLPPVFQEIAAKLHLSPADVTTLSAVPVVCFGVFSVIAARLGRRFGDERVLFAALIVLTVSLALRGMFPGVALFPATIFASGAIAIMNVLLSAMIKRRVPGHAGLVIGIYLLSLSVGSIIGSLISVPVYQAAGGSVRPVLGLWALPAAVATIAWLPQLRHGRPVAVARLAVPPSPAGQPAFAQRPSGSGHAVHRRALAWQVALFMGLQSLMFYSTLSWLPSLFRDRGASAAGAGVLISIMSLAGLPTALLIPVLAHRAADQRAFVIPTVLLSGAGIGTALFAPVSTAVLSVSLLGIAQGSALGLAIFFTMARAATPAIAASLSALAQSVGYLVASAGPLLVGFLHSATATWTIPVLLLLGFSVFQLVAGYLAARDRVIE